MLVELVENHLGVFTAFHVDNKPYALPVGLVPYVGDSLYLLLPHKLRDFLGKPRLVNLVGKLGDDYHFPVSLLLLLYAHPGLHLDYSAARGVGGADVLPAAYETPGGKIRPRHDLKQFVHGDLGVAYLGHHGVEQFPEIMGRDIGRHANRDPRGTVQKQVRHLGGQDARLKLPAIVVRVELDRFLVQVLKHLRRDS